MRSQIFVVPAIAAFSVATLLSIQARAAEPAEAKSGEIVVRVIDRAGAPQPGAAVSLFTYDPTPGTFVAVSRDQKTDASGIVRLDAFAIDRVYLMRATTPAGLVGYRQRGLEHGDSKFAVELKLGRPMVATVHVQNEDGAPVSGASIGWMSFGDSKDSVPLKSRDLPALGLADNRSNSSGDLLLPELPAGTIDLKLIHPDYAPADLKGFDSAKRQRANVTLFRGVKLKVRIMADPQLPPVAGLLIEYAHGPDRDGSTNNLPLAPLRPDGTTEITLAAGKYNFLTLFHPSYLVTPVYEQKFGPQPAEEPEYFELPGGDGLTFRVQQRVKVRGRVLDEAMRRPVVGVVILGKIPSHAERSPLERFTLKWTRVGQARTNERGEFEMSLAAGPAKLIVGRGFVSRGPDYQVDVAPDGSTIVPDILVRPMPRVHGVVFDQNGKKLPGAIVRFRGTELTFEEPATITNTDGAFDLSPPWIPVDPRTGVAQPEQIVVAYHPYAPFAAECRIRLDRESSLDHVELRMKPQEYPALLTAYPDEFVPWLPGTISTADAKRQAAVSLVGKSAPELDGAAWLNTDKPKMSLADFRGKFVLLQFWATWCGPCHRDMPNVKLAYDLYKDKGLVVIGVHDNSMPLDAIKADAAKNGLSYPIVVDHPDGRLYASFREHGMAPYYPSYVLIGPDGNVLLDDRTVAGPTLGIFKIEIIRELLMTRRSAGR